MKWIIFPIVYMVGLFIYYPLAVAAFVFCCLWKFDFIGVWKGFQSENVWNFNRIVKDDPMFWIAAVLVSFILFGVISEFV